MKIINGIIAAKRINKFIIDKLIVFFVCFLPKFIIAINSIMINTISDETSAISVAALLAGYDWRDVVSNAGYYGIGYLFVFFPLFKAGISAVHIYRIILAVNAVLIGFTGVVCYSILIRFFKLENRFVKVTISCTCGCMSIFSTSITRSRNEDIYLLCGWLFAYIVLILLDETTVKKTKYEVLLLSLLFYMLTIHTRSVTYIIALILACGIYWLIFHKRLVSKFFWIFLISGYGVVEFVLKLYQKWVWQSSSAGNASLGRTVSSAMTKIAIDFTMIKSIFMIVLGQFFTAFSLSGGIFLISFVVFAIFIFQCIKGRERLQTRETALLMLGVLYGLMIMITIGGQCIIWGVNVYQGLVTGKTDYVYAYKAFTYMRYMGSYVPVFIMTALIIAWKDRNIWKKACLGTSMIFIALFLFWFGEILPYVQNTKSNMEFFISVVSLPGGIQNSVTTWYEMFLILFMMMFFWMFFRSKKYFTAKLLIIGVIFTSYERMEIFFNKVLPIEERYLMQIDAGNDVMQQLHNRLLEDDIPICVVEARNGVNYLICYLYQFVNYDLHIIPGSKEEISQTDIIFSNGKIAEYLDGDYICFVLDENEYLYCNNLDYSKMIEEMGYEEFAE